MIRGLARMILPPSAVGRIRDYRYRRSLPARARAADSQDKEGLPSADPGAREAIRLALGWLCRAQDQSATNDGGVARHFGLIDGWGASYPETTGYIVPTVLDEARLAGDGTLEARGRRMLDWLVSIQFPEGGFQGGLVTHEPRVPVTFNTGQILLGLAAGARLEPRGGPYTDAMHRAAAWLVSTQDGDGCWRRHPTPFAKPGDKAYETHVAWGLFEAERVAPGNGYGEAGLRQVGWALTRQQANGWFRDCCLSDPAQPLTHTLGYVLRGILEAHRLSGEPAHLDAAVLTGSALKSCLASDGRLSGRFDKEWRGTVDWCCLTGSVQIAHCWFRLYEILGDAAYLEAGRRANAFVRRTLSTAGDPDIVGGVKGAFPVSGDYGAYEYLNWAAKFLIDANRYELDLS